jgi:hypothetical protein
MGGRRLLPEGSLRMHHAWTSRGEGHALDQTRRIADDVACTRGLPRRSRSEFEHGARRHISRAGRRRFVVNEQLLAFDADGGRQSFSSERICDDRLNAPFNPLRQALAHLAGPAFFLAPGLRECLAVFAHEVGCNRPDVLGQIDVLGKPPDDLIGFG